MNVLKVKKDPRLIFSQIFSFFFVQPQGKLSLMATSWPWSKNIF